MPVIDKKILAIIPARGGSKGLPGKNIKLLVGKPLIAYSIEAAKKSKHVDRVIVTSDDKNILETSAPFGAELIQRPAELALDETKMPPVIQHVIDTLKTKDNYRPDIVLLLQPTCPLRTSKHIDEAIEHFSANDFDSLLSVLVLYKQQFVVENEKYLQPLLKERPNRQDRKPVILENGVIYLTMINLMEQGTIVGGKIGYYPMHIADSPNIDDQEDFLFAERLIKGSRDHE
ncbi:MAG: acylneuraminate cytidylyltransferase family protein [Candidatus Doudnabacteria bacterium]|nr:acylneuraminate cytidylyltransferase family protein [bacterium]MDZ4243741.1 acylneuraminate cytidylyltransferase family protein [Candidatus Doudnabacteria bacterium]